MQEATILTWHRQEGDRFEAGELLLEVEAAKTTVEVEAPSAGTLVRIVARPEEVVPVGGLLAELAIDGEAVPTPAPAPQASAAPAAGDADASRSPAVQSRPRAEFAGGQVEPRARRLAKENDVDLSALKGSGPGGRITEEDVRAAMAASGRS